MEAIRALLERHGYALAREARINDAPAYRFLGPSSESGQPGVRVFKARRTGEYLTVSSHGDDPLNDSRAHDAFGVFTILEHAGNAKAAAQALGALGHQSPRPETATEQKAKPTPRPQSVDENSTHHDLSEHWIRKQGEPPPVGVEGKIWRYRDDLWRSSKLERIETEIGCMYQTKTCKRKGDYKGIAKHIHDIVDDSYFFDTAPGGLMTPGGFFTVQDKKVQHLEPDPNLRQRFCVTATPTPRRAKRWEEYLDQTFAHDSWEVAHKQKKLLQEIIGVALTGDLYKFQKAVLLYGLSKAGKSTLLRIIEELFPGEFVAAVSPFEWDQPYSRAALAGKRINLVGELPHDKLIPSAQFKQIIGRDRISARNPYGIVFDFIPKAGHFFNSNHFLATSDHHEAFWTRWFCLGFFNVVPPEDRDESLDEHIVQNELPAILHWALDGASRALSEGFSTGPMHDELMRKWRIDADAVAQFFGDEDAVVQDEHWDTKRGDVYQAFRAWCKNNERRGMGKKTFFDRTEAIGYTIFKRGDWFVHGVRMLPF